MHAGRTTFEAEERRLGTRSRDYTNPVPVAQSPAHRPSPPPSPPAISALSSERQSGCPAGRPGMDGWMDWTGQLMRNGRFFTSR